MKKIIFILMFITLISLAGASQETLGTFKQRNCIQLIQTCSDCNYNNISRIHYPDGTPIAEISNIAMEKDDTYYNYTFCNTTELGTYIVHGFGDPASTKTSWVYDFDITEGGDTFDSSQPIMLLGMFGLVALFFGIGVTFNKERWKLRSFFFLCALLMGLLFLNSIRIVIGTSTNLAQMGSMGLVLGIVILSFMFLYTFISYTIEVFNYFKAKRRMKWDISEK